jgi:hypothetical protein
MNSQYVHVSTLTGGVTQPALPTQSTSHFELTVNCSENVRYLGLFIDCNAHMEKIMATRARGTLKSMNLLGNSVKGLDHCNWRKQLSKILQDVPDEAVRRMLGAFRTAPSEPLHRLIAVLPIHIRLQLLSKTTALTLLTIPNSSQLIQRLGVPWCNMD